MKNNKHSYLPFTTACAMFFFMVFGLFEENHKTNAFAQDGILHANSAKETNNEIVDEIFNNLYEQPFLEPNIEIYDFQHTPHSLKNFRKKFVIVYFWATWCNSCIQEMKTMVEMVKKLEFKDISDVVIIPVSIDFKTNKQIAEIYQTHDLTKLRMFVDPRKELMSALSVNSLPTTFFINKEGYVIQGIEQELDWSRDTLINKILAIKGPAEKQAPIQLTKPEVAPNKNDDSAKEKAIVPDIKKKKKPMIIR